MKRRRLTERQTLLVAVRQGALIGCARCYEPFTEGTINAAERDHKLPVGLGGTDDIENQVYLCRGCHKIKTATDKAVMAKADRQRRHHETGRSSAKKRVAKIASRGFDKGLRKKFSGEVVPRD